MILLYKVYVGECADETGKIPISIPSVDGKSSDLKCGAGSDDSLIMYFQDKFWAEKDRFYLKDVSAIDERIRNELEKILNKDEDRRAHEHLDFKDNTKEKLPKRRPRTYVLYRNGRPL